MIENEINQTKLDALLKSRELEEKYGSGAMVLVDFHLSELIKIFDELVPYRILIRDIVAKKLNFWLEVKHAIEKNA